MYHVSSTTSATTPLVVEPTGPTTKHVSNFVVAAEPVSPHQESLSNSEALACCLCSNQKGEKHPLDPKEASHSTVYVPPEVH